MSSISSVITFGTNNGMVLIVSYNYGVKNSISTDYLLSKLDDLNFVWWALPIEEISTVVLSFI